MCALFLDTLPTEILYRIFDSLDIQTILLSLRYVCKRLYLTTNLYNRYDFNFKSIAKPHLYFICQLIPFENVVSLTLSNEDKTRGQIQLFLSLCHIEQFIRLKSLSLLQIEDVHLSIFLNSIFTSSLQSLSISTQTVQPNQNATASLLSSAVAHRSLENLYLNILPKDWDHAEWPVHHTLRYLRTVNTITLKHFCSILQHFINLHTLVIKEINSDDDGQNICANVFPQLTSLIFEDSRIQINTIERCLSSTPSLTYLKLMGSGSSFHSSFEGFRWEKVIQEKLTLLKKFEFFFRISMHGNYLSRGIELLMKSFQSPFWLDDIHCFINCDYIVNSRRIMLYTLPICSTSFVYHTDLKKISLSNFTTRINEADTDYVQQLELKLTRDVNSQSKGQVINMQM